MDTVEQTVKILESDQWEENKEFCLLTAMRLFKLRVDWLWWWYQGCMYVPKPIKMCTFKVCGFCISIYIELFERKKKKKIF